MEAKPAAMTQGTGNLGILREPSEITNAEVWAVHWRRQASRARIVNDLSAPIGERG
jgi:hypothetical protein